MYMILIKKNFSSNNKYYANHYSHYQNLVMKNREATIQYDWMINSSKNIYTETESVIYNMYNKIFK